MALSGDTSDLDALKYGGIDLLPDRSGYSLSRLNGVISSDVSGGMQKQQVQFFNQPFRVTVTYRAFDALKAAWLMRFFDRNRGQKFVASLIVKTVGAEQFVCQRIGEYQYTNTGIGGDISMTLEIDPYFADDCFNEWTDWAYQCNTPNWWCEIMAITKTGAELLP